MKLEAIKYHADAALAAHKENKPQLAFERLHGAFVMLLEAASPSMPETPAVPPPPAPPAPGSEA